jgi:hypothetical protein
MSDCPWNVPPDAKGATAAAPYFTNQGCLVGEDFAVRFVILGDRRRKRPHDDQTMPIDYGRTHLKLQDLGNALGINS